MAVIIVCPPHAAHGIDSPQPIFCKGPLPVFLPEKDSDGDGYARGLSFDDAARCHTFTRKIGRKHPTPLWTQSDAAVRRVLLAFMEARAFGPKGRERLSGLGDRDRLIAVVQKLKSKRDALIVVIERLCNEFVVTADPHRRRVLQTEIQNLDKQIILSARADVFFDLIVAYYRERLSSVDCAARTGLSPWGCRALLHRMNKCAKALGYRVEISEPRPRPTPEQIAWAKEQRRLAHAERTEAKRNARLLKPAAQPVCAPCQITRRMRRSKMLRSSALSPRWNMPV
jgi:hypothetical protein